MGPQINPVKSPPEEDIAGAVTEPPNVQSMESVTSPKFEKKQSI